MEDSNLRKKRKVYSTETINKLIKERNEGYEIDFSPFFQRDLDLRAPGVVFNMTEDEYNEYTKCCEDPLYFITNYCKFKTDDGDVLVTLREFQKKIINLATEEVYNEELDRVVPKRRNIIWMAARQSGKTTTLCSILAHKMIFNPSYNCAVMANKDDTAKELVSKITEIFRGLPYFLKPGCNNFGKTGMSLENGSKLMSAATTNTASIGFTIHFMILDEFAHIPENIVNNFWRSVYPTLSSSAVSQCMIISTPNGTTNKFYEIWSKSVEGRNSFVNLRTDYWEVPGHDSKWAAQQRADFGDEEFAQEFELQFNKSSKALLTAEDMTFIDRLSTDFVHKDIVGIQNQFLNDKNLVWHPKFDPNNIDPNDRFVFLVDIAEGGQDPDEKVKERGDRSPDSNTINIFKLRLNSPANVRKYSSISCGIRDCVRLEQIGRYSSNTEDEVYAADVASALSYALFNDDMKDCVRIMIEMNFNGTSFYNQFKRHARFTESTLVKTYHKKPVPGEKAKKKVGCKTTSNKESYCLRGKKMLTRRRTIIHCKETFTQMKSFGYVRGKLKGIACHDDLSMPVFNHIPRLFDEDDFVAWIGDYIYFHPDRARVYALNQIIEKWALDNPDMSDDAFTSLYKPDDQPQYRNPYMFGQQEQNPYIGGFGQIPSPYSSGGFGMLQSPYVSGGFGQMPSPYSEGAYPQQYNRII